MKKEKSPIVFFPVPSKILNFAGDLKLNPEIPFPVEPPADDQESFDPEKISIEMIISGMLRVILAHSQNNTVEKPEDSPHLKTNNSRKDIPLEWIDYYRRFVLTARPEIYHQFTVASIVKAQNGEFDMALEINAVIESLFPFSPGVLLNKALILDTMAASIEKNGHKAERENVEALEAKALQAYEAALSTEPALPDTLFNAAFFFMRRKDFARARECFTQYIRTSEHEEIPDNKKKEAQKVLREISSQGLDDYSIREACDCINTGNNEEGLLKIKAFIERHPKAQNGWFLLGWTLRKLGRYSDGFESLKKAAQLGGGNCDIQNEMAICLMELGDLKGAKKELEKALREEPENVKIISNLGVLAQKSGNMNEAEAFFRTVLELDPDDPLARHFFQS